MSENLQKSPQSINERFGTLPRAEQKLLIYYCTIPATSDIGIEELSDPSLEIAGDIKEVFDAIKDLEAQGLLQRGFNPLREQRNLPTSPEMGQNRFYITPDVYKFITQDLPQIWKESGLI